MDTFRRMSQSFATSRTSGFTLIELLVVIAIIGLLAAVVLSALGTARGKGVDASVKSQLNSARQQMELFASNGTAGYTGGCSAAASATGLGGSASGGILYNAANATGNSARITTLASTAGAYNYVTCHDSYGAYAIEAPLSSSVGTSPVMWCVDSNGASRQETSNLGASGATQYACP